MRSPGRRPAHERCVTDDRAGFDGSRAGSAGLACAGARGGARGAVGGRSRRTPRAPRWTVDAATYGANKFADAPKEPRWRAFLRQYSDPMQFVLLVAGIACLFLPGQFPTGILLILLTLLNAFMGVNQEGKAEASVAALQKMMVVQAKVAARRRARRRSRWRSSSPATS